MPGKGIVSVKQDYFMIMVVGSTKGKALLLRKIQSFLFSTASKQALVFKSKARLLLDHGVEFE